MDIKPQLTMLGGELHRHRVVFVLNGRNRTIGEIAHDARQEIERLERVARDLAGEVFQYNGVTCSHGLNPKDCASGCAFEGEDS